jgi:hypothetical protein
MDPTVGARDELGKLQLDKRGVDQGKREAKDFETPVSTPPDKEEIPEAMEPDRNQDESRKELAAKTVRHLAPEARFEQPGGYSVRISPYRCALCSLKFSSHNKMMRRAASCRGRAWCTKKSRFFNCRAWLCRYDDKCEEAKKPCPCCGHIKKMELSYADILPHEQIPMASNPIVMIPSHATNIIWGDKTDNFTVRWTEEV